MALKAYINGSMKRLTRHQMVTFIGGVKRRIPKGVTFVNGEKKVLWQIGNVEFNSWTLTELQYPYASTTSTVLNALEADDTKVVFNVDRYVSRANVANVSAPYGENTVEYGGITYRQPTSTINNTYYDSNILSAVSSSVGGSVYYTLTLTCNQINIDKADMTVTATQTATSSKNGSGAITLGKRYYDGLINVGGSYGMIRIYGSAGALNIYKNYSLSSQTTVATISCYGYSVNVSPAIPKIYAIYNNRYLLLPTFYKATSEADAKYFLKKIDLSTGAVTNLLSEQNEPVTGILIDGEDIIVTINNTMLKLSATGTIQDTYTSANDLPTIVGKSGNFYYLTTTRAETDADYMNIEIVDDSNFTSEVIQTNVKMIDTISMPYDSENGYLCFATRFYVSSAYTGPNSSIPSGSRRSSIKMTGISGGVTISNLELRICRIKCY